MAEVPVPTTHLQPLDEPVARIRRYKLSTLGHLFGHHHTLTLRSSSTTYFISTQSKSCLPCTSPRPALTMLSNMILGRTFVALFAVVAMTARAAPLQQGGTSLLARQDGDIPDGGVPGEGAATDGSEVADGGDEGEWIWEITAAQIEGATYPVVNGVVDTSAGTPNGAPGPDGETDLEELSIQHVTRALSNSSEALGKRQIADSVEAAIHITEFLQKNFNGRRDNDRNSRAQWVQQTVAETAAKYHKNVFMYHEFSHSFNWHVKKLNAAVQLERKRKDVPNTTEYYKVVVFTGAGTISNKGDGGWMNWGWSGRWTRFNSGHTSTVVFQ